jgi:hypothetical protein
MGSSGRELFYMTPDSKLMQISLKRGSDSIEPAPTRELFALPIAYDNYICGSRKFRSN